MAAEQHHLAELLGRLTDFVELRPEALSTLSRAVEREAVALREGQRFEVGVSLTVRLRPTDAKAARALIDDPERSRGLPVALPEKLRTPEFLNALLEAEPVILEALEDRDTAALFALNPVAVLERLEDRIAPELLEAGHEARRITPPVAQRLPGLRLKSVGIEVVRDKRAA